MNGQTRAFLTVLLGLFVWVMALRSTLGLGRAIVGYGNAATLQQQRRPPHIDSLIQQALSEAPRSKERRFAYDGPSPFSTGGTRIGRGSAAVRAVPARPAIAINGVLFQSSNPQAVVQGPDGSSVICSEGDSAFGLVVVRIERDRVVFRDASGLWDVAVRE